MALLAVFLPFAFVSDGLVANLEPLGRAFGVTVRRVSMPQGVSSLQVVGSRCEFNQMNSECKRIETCFVECMKRISQPKLKGPLSKIATACTINYTKLRYGAYVCGVFHTRDSCNVEGLTL